MSHLSRALRAAAALPARLYSAAQALRGPTVSAAYHREQTALLEERVRIAEDARERAEAERDAWKAHSDRMWEQRNAHVAIGNDYLRQKNEQYARFEARGMTILRLQHRLTRWQRRYRRAMVALVTWRPEALAWKDRAEALAAEVASLRARRAHLDAGPVVRRSAVDGLFPGAMVADEDL